MKQSKLVFLYAYIGFFVSFVQAQEPKVRFRMMLFVNKDYLPADTLIKNFNFYFTDLTTVAGMVDVPHPTKAEAWKDVYIAENGEKMHQTHIICLTQPLNTKELPSLIVEEKSTKRAAFVFELNDSTVKEWTVVRVPFKLGGFRIQDLSTFHLLDDPSHHLHQGMLHKRATNFFEISEEELQKIADNKQHTIDTLCNDIAYPAYKASVFLVKNSIHTNDSLSFVIRLKLPKRYHALEVQHNLRYVQTEELDTEPQIQIRLLLSGKLSKKEEVKTLFIRIPPIQRPGQYWLSFTKVLNQNTQIIANHSHLGCPMIVNID